MAINLIKKKAPPVKSKAPALTKKAPVAQQDDDEQEDEQEDEQVEVEEEEEAPKVASKKKVVAPKEEDDDDDDDDDDDEEEEKKPIIKKVAKPAVKSTAQEGKPLNAAKGLSFVKRGSAAKKIMEKEDLMAEQKAAKGNIRRFWMKPDSSVRLTFLDGDMKDGMLDIPFLYQHSVFMNGNYNNHFICTNDEEPCPICEGGDSPSYVGVLTVCVHDEFTSKKDQKVYKDQIQLYMAKKPIVKQLMKSALKRGGLTGWTVDVSRSQGKSSSVGDGFDFEEKHTLAELQKMYGNKEKTIKPFNYDEVLAGLYVTAKDLRKMGFGGTKGPVGSEDAPEEDYEDVL